MTDAKIPLCNRCLSTIRHAGIKAKSFGDSEGLIEELFKA